MGGQDQNEKENCSQWIKKITMPNVFFYNCLILHYENKEFSNFDILA